MDVSLVIPVLNEEASLPRLLDSIRRQTSPPAEIIFVDGGSADATRSLITDAGKNDPRIRLQVEPGATPGRGRNVGIQVARNPWIALTDAGIELDPGWLQGLIARANEVPDTRIIYGNFQPRVESYFAQCLALAYVPAKMEHGGERIRGPFIASSLLHREVWEAAGGFPDLRAAEDRIFMERVEQMHVPTAWAPEASVTWDLPESWKKLFVRFKTYSMHNILAGRQRDWHYGVARMYLAALGLAFVAWYVHVGFWLLLLVLGLARGVKSIVERREGHGIAWCLRPDRVLAVCLVLLWIDGATFSGWAVGAWKQALGKNAVLGTDQKASKQAPHA